MAVIGTYTKGVIKTNAKLRENQEVLIIPIKKKNRSSKITAFGGLHKYANEKMIPFEKEALEDEFIKAYLSEENRS